jgi:hypothetical protein
VTSTDSQSRVLDCMIDHGVDGICIMVDYSEQFLLLDDERNTARPVHRSRAWARAVGRGLQPQVPIAPGGQRQMALALSSPSCAPKGVTPLLAAPTGRLSTVWSIGCSGPALFDGGKSLLGTLNRPITTWWCCFPTLWGLGPVLGSQLVHHAVGTGTALSPQIWALVQSWAPILRCWFSARWGAGTVLSSQIVGPG